MQILFGLDVQRTIEFERSAKMALIALKFDEIVVY